MADNWRTPTNIWNKLNAEFHFDLDAAADDKNALLPNFLCKEYFHGALGLARWPGDRIYLNPPYGRMLEKFVRRAWKEASAGKTVVALIPMRTRGAWWHECVIGKAVEVRCVRKRIKFLRPDDASEPEFTGSCDSAIVVWRGCGTGKTEITSWTTGDNK